MATAPLIEWQTEWHAELDSTNRAAAERILPLWQALEPAEGLVIAAHRQSAGRGQHGRRWESPSGGLYFSAVVEQVPPPARDRLALVAGVSAAEALRESEHLPITLRWPNDLMHNGKKVGGILCESLVQADRYAGIIGVGINVNTTLSMLPEPLRESAGTLVAVDGRERDLRALLEQILARIDLTLQQIAAEGLAPLVRQARALDVLAGQPVEFQDGTLILRGVAAGLSDSGDLLIRSENTLHTLTTGTLLSVNNIPLRK